VLTGCRRGEIAGLKWSEVDLDTRQLRLAEAKEGYSLRPLGQAAVDLVASLKRHDKSDAVFARGEDGVAYQGLPKAWERIAKRAKLRGVTLHTLRHSLATTANTLELSEPTIVAMLGHSRETVTARYVHVVDATVSAAAEGVGGAISHAMAQRKPATALKLKARRTVKKQN